MESDKKGVREFEIKYKKLEKIFEEERGKMNTERARNKSEMAALKKAVEEAEAALGMLFLTGFDPFSKVSHMAIDKRIRYANQPPCFTILFFCS